MSIYSFIFAALVSVVQLSHAEVNPKIFLITNNINKYKLHLYILFYQIFILIIIINMTGSDYYSKYQLYTDF